MQRTIGPGPGRGNVRPGPCVCVAVPVRSVGHDVQDVATTCATGAARGRAARHRQAVPGRHRQPRHRHRPSARAPSTPSSGENGAGKSTLMKILYGVQKPDEGTISVDGEPRSFASPSDAIARGIGMVFQHFMLADNLTVLENVVLGAEKLHGIGDEAREPRSRRSPSATASASTPTSWSRTSASASASGSRSSRCSTAAPRSSSSTSRPPCWCRRRSTRSSTTCASCKAEGHTLHLHLPQARRGARGRRRHHRHPPRHHGRHGQARGGHPRQLAELMVGSELPSPRPRSPRSPTTCCSRSSDVSSSTAGRAAPQRHLA